MMFIIFNILRLVFMINYKNKNKKGGYWNNKKKEL